MTALAQGARVRALRVIPTPGHTPGHLSLLNEQQGLLLVGDVAGVTGGTLARAPAPFTADPELAEHSLRLLCGLGADRALFSHGPEIPHGPALLQALADAGPPDPP